MRVHRILASFQVLIAFCHASFYFTTLSDELPGIAIGKLFNITWTPSSDTTISLFLVAGSGNYQYTISNVALNISNIGVAGWYPPTWLQGGPGYRLKIVDDLDPSNYQISGSFSIPRPTFTTSRFLSTSTSLAATLVPESTSPATPSTSSSATTQSHDNLTPGQLAAAVVASVVIVVILLAILFYLTRGRTKHCHYAVPGDSKAPPLPPRPLKLPPFPELETNANRIELEADVKRRNEMAAEMAANESEKRSLLEVHKLGEEEANKMEKNIEPKVIEEKAADEDEKKSLIEEHELEEEAMKMDEKVAQEGGGRSPVQEQHEALTRYRENADDFSVIGEAGVIETGKAENLNDGEREIAREYYEPVFYSPGKKSKQDVRLSIYK